MASVKGFSVSRTAGGGTGPSSTVYSYSSGLDLQDGSPLSDGDTDREDASRTGWSPAYNHRGAAGQGDGIAPTLLNAPNATGAATGVTLDTAGTGNDNIRPDGSAGDVIASTTNITAGCTGGGLILRVTVNATGVPTGVAIEDAGQGYAAADTDDVSIDGFPGSQVSVTVA
jgi:hypothetical protein